MGRVYHRVTQRGADGFRYTSEALARAISDVKEKRKTIKGAAKFYNIPRTTLRHRLNGSRGRGRLAVGGTGGGRNTDIPFEIEQRLANSLKVLEKWGFGLTRAEVLDIVQIYVNNNKMKTRFKNGRPGEEWYLRFSRRHRLSLKKPQSVEYTRMDQINPFVIYSYFEQLSDTMKDLNLLDKPHQIFNLDESSFCHDPNKAKIVGAIRKRSTRMISSPGRENTSVLICCSAAGEKIPPLVIFKGKNVLEHWLNVTENDKTFYAASQRGWMETTMFAKWFKDLPNTPKERPLLLVYDGHSTHVSIEIIQLALDNEVTILKLPPHTTHVLQPLDVAVFKSMKNQWEKELLVWQRHNPRQRIPKAIFVDILNKVYDKLSLEVIRNGFQATGIYPVSQDVINTEIFKPSDLKAYQRYKQTKDSTITNEESNDPNIEEIPDIRHENEENLNPNVGFTEGAEKSYEQPTHHNAEEDGSHSNDNENEENLNPNVGFTEGAEKPYEQLTHHNAEEDGSHSNDNDELNPDLTDTNEDLKLNAGAGSNDTSSFEKILLSFIKGATSQSPKPKTSRKRICSMAEIITTKEYLNKRKKDEEAKKEALEIKENKKKAALEKKKERQQKIQAVKNKKTATPSSSESESDTSIQEIERDSLEDVEESTIEVITDDYVIVSYESQYYPGQVIEIHEDSDEANIKHMEKSGKLDGWKWPKRDDILKYHLKDILKIIPPPTPINNRGMFKIPALLQRNMY